MADVASTNNRSAGGTHAIVIGASMAGLVAARVLAAYFDRVTTIERDTLPDHPAFRNGVPQARHTHLLLTRGQNLLERLFPGLRAELAAHGAPMVDWNADCAWHNPAGWGPRFSSHLQTCTSSRDLLEWTVRKRVSAHPRIQILTRQEVTGLLTDAVRTRVTGVKVRSRGESAGERSEVSEIIAGLVLDASGRTSRAPEWLEELGYERPRETVINALLRYSTRLYEQPADPNRDWKTLLIASVPPRTSKGGIIYPIENGRWHVTLGGVADEQPPTDEQGFIEFARSLDSPALYEAIKDARPLSQVYGYARTENRLRHYEELSRRPENFVLLGDAVCCFNPIYGQGMTTAALGAMTLARCLAETRRKRPGDDLSGLATLFQKRLAKTNQPAWINATGEDFRWPTTIGGKPDRLTRAIHKYIDEVLGLAYQDPEIKRRFFDVIHMLRPGQVLFAPRVLLPVLGRVIAHRGWKGAGS